MISISRHQALHVQAFVVRALNLDDDGIPLSPAPFSYSNVRYTPRDWPRAGSLYAMLREVSMVEQGEPSIEHVPESGPEDLVSRFATQANWTVQLVVVSKFAESDPQLEDSAGMILRRVTRRMATSLADDMRTQGIAPMRWGQILSLHRIARTAQWETRAGVDLTFAVGSSIVERPGWIESVEGTGTLSPLPGLTFEADADEPPP